MRRVLCVQLPQWPLQRRTRAEPALRGRPLVVVGRRGRAEQVLHCGAVAARAGVAVGMTRAEAVATLPELTVLAAEPAEDRAALKRLAAWAERFSPIVGLEEAEEPASLLMEMSGGLACFGGEERFFATARTEFQAAGWRARLALADTVGAAWALAHFGEAATLAAPGGSLALLPPLPCAALRLPPATVARLTQLGVTRIEGLQALPRDGVARRFGGVALRRLDQAFGRLPEPITPLRPAPAFRGAWRFETPTASRAELRHRVDELLRTLAAELEARQQGVRRLECVLTAEAGPPQRLTQEMHQPSRSADRLGALLAVRLEQVRLPGPLLAVTLAAQLTEPLTAAQAELFEREERRQEQEWAALLEGLTARLGAGAVSFAPPRAEVLPELACGWTPACGAGSADAGDADRELLRHRPLRLWPEPRPVEAGASVPDGAPEWLRCGQGEWRVRRAWGPERLAGGWWREADVGRDYYAVETEAGARLWLFRAAGRWWWHGCFD